MAVRDEWLKIRQELLRDIKKQVASRIGALPFDLVRYRRGYNAEFSRLWTPTDYETLFASIDSAQVVLGADFHAFSQSQRIHLRILRQLAAQRPITLALEALSTEQNTSIESFLAGKMNESEFLKRVQWEKRWGFPFANYRPLFDLAKERGFRIIGLSQTVGKDLTQRDQLAAQVIRRELNENSAALVYVVIGDLHLASCHLPKVLFGANWTQSKRLVTILQNSEHLYFRLARKRQEQSIEVMRSGRQRFCVLSSPPWVKWQSYLMYLEQMYDQEFADDTVDYTEHVVSMVQLLSRDLQVRVATDRLNVHSASRDIDGPMWLKQLSGSMQKVVQTLMRQERSLYLPERSVVWLGRPSTNHAAAMAGVFIHATISGRKKTPHHFPKDFVAAIWIEAFGFFASKLMNHQRKCLSLQEIKSQLLAPGMGRKNSEVYRLVLSQRLREMDGRYPKLRCRVDEKMVFIEAARILGHMMGERLFLRYLSGRISKRKLKSWMVLDPMKADFEKHYLRILECCE